MAAIGIRMVERAQKRMVLAAVGLALLLHLMVAGMFGWYKVRGIEIPNDHSTTTGPFTVKHIEIDPNALKSEVNPIANLPKAEPAQNAAQFQLDPQQVNKVLQAHLPQITAPAVPEPNRVIAATDVSQNLPYVESDNAKISEEITKVQPAMNSGPPSTSKLAQDVIDAVNGPDQAGIPPGAKVAGTGSNGNVPGFADLASGFKAPAPTVTNLPDPVLLRLPSDVLFDFDSAVLKPQAAGLLGQAVGMITKYPSADVQIDGYTDSFGRPDYNLTLSQQRAQAVQAWLQARVGQTGFKFRSQGHGSSDYVVSSHGSIQQQQPNRRVEILIQALKL